MKVAEALQKLGFNIHLLASEKYVLNKLQSLSDVEVQTIRESFIKNCQPRFMKYFFCHMPFGRKQDYAKEVSTASVKRLKHLIKICGGLIQMKVYFFWHARNAKLSH
ncbi:MAG: hypothetical protein QXZ70_07845 [Candidatus Bathyarchaeia archaeon]